MENKFSEKDWQVKSDDDNFSIRLTATLAKAAFFGYTDFMETKLFDGKTALIVGGTGGIGRAISRALAGTGANLVIHGSRAGEKSDSLAREIKEISGKTPKIISHDLLATPFAELDASEIVHEAQKCDILCVCFGPFVQKPLHETTLADWQKVALFDYALPGLLVSSALPNMMRNQFGRILLFGGTGTTHRTEFFTNAAYAGAKTALNVLVSSVAAAYAQSNITCNMISPGHVGTEYLTAPQKAVLSARMPGGRLIPPSAIAETALLLLSAPDISGTTLRVDRGWSPHDPDGRQSGTKPA